MMNMAVSSIGNDVSLENESEIISKKVFVVPSKAHIVDEQNKEHPWYLFPEENFDDLSEASGSDSSFVSSSEEALDKENDIIKKEIVVTDGDIHYSKEIGKPFKCAFCEKTYKKKGHLERHQLKHSVQDDKIVTTRTHECMQCGYQASCIGNFKKHMLTHSGERPFSCYLCEKSFRQKVHLKDHLRSHAGKRDFECEECGATFVQKSSLKLHQRKHSGIRPYSCNLCDRSFFENQHLVNHMRTHTGEKPYQCETCGQTFSTLRTLKTHNMIHTGERPYKCETCGVSFREKSTMQKHRAVHINVGPFPCSECGKVFSRLASLTLHSKIHSHNSTGVISVTKNSCSVSTQKNLENAVSNEGSSATLIQKLEKENSESVSEIKTGKLMLEVNCAKYSELGVQQFDQEEHFEEKHLIKTEVFSNAIQENDLKEGINFCNASLGKKRKTGHHTQEQTTAAHENLDYGSSKNPTTSLDNIAHPDHVQHALEYGTVWETKDDDGNDFIVVLPAILSNRDLVFTTQNNKAIIPFQPAKPVPFKSFSGLQEFDNTSAGEIQKDLDGEQMTTSQELEIYRNEIGGEAGMESMQMEDVQHSSDDGGMDIEIFASSSLDDEPIMTKSFKSDGENIQEISSDNPDLFTWDEETVTYVIEEGQGEPIKLLQNTLDSSAKFRVISSKQRKKTANADGDKDILYTYDTSLRKAKKSSAACEEKRRVPRRTKDKKEKLKSLFECRQCGKTCKSSSNLITHLRTHSGERPYFCDVCGAGFKQIAHLKAHVRIHTGEKPYACDQCDAAFTQSSRLNSHKKALHGDGRKSRGKKSKIVSASKIRNFYCRICKKTFLDECFKKDHTREHKISALDSGSVEQKKKAGATSEYQCDICGVMYNNRISLNRHRLGHADFKFVCETCGLSFQDNNSLQSHSISMHGVKIESDDIPGMYINVKIGTDQDFVVVNPSIKCVLKGENSNNAARQKIIQLEDDLSENHKGPLIRVTETFDGDVKSDVTQGSEYANSASYNQDFKTVHVSDGIKVEPLTPTKVELLETASQDEFVKKECAKKIYNDDDTKKAPVKKPKLKYDFINSEGKKVWACKLCSKPFYQSSNLHCHMRSHTGEKPFKCNECPKAFKQITHLKEHMHKHTGQKSFGCSTCGAHFTQRGTVKRHIQVIHKGAGEIEKVKSFAKRRSDACGDIFVRRRSKAPRSSSMSQQQSKMETCAICGKDYPSSYLLSHIRCHTGEKPFQCSICQESFRQKTHLKSHMKRHVLEKMYTCSQCGFSCQDFLRLKLHKKTCSEEDFTGNASGEVSDFESGKNVLDKNCIADSMEHKSKTVSSRKKTFLCKLCMFYFSSKAQLESHMETCDASNSDSDSSLKSEEIPYQDGSDNEALTAGRKCSRKRSGRHSSQQTGTNKNDKHKRISLYLQGSGSIPKNSLECKTSEAQNVCKFCGANFRRTSALKFHYNMKHGNKNEDMSEEEDDVKKDYVEIDGKGRLQFAPGESEEKETDSQTLLKKRILQKVDLGENSEKDLKTSEHLFKTAVKRKRRSRAVNKLQEESEYESSKKQMKINSKDDDCQSQLYCDICKLSFQKPSFLALHIGSRHPSVEKEKVRKTRNLRR